MKAVTSVNLSLHDFTFTAMMKAVTLRAVNRKV